MEFMVGDFSGDRECGLLPCQAFGILDEYSTFQVTTVALRKEGVIAILSL